MTRSTPEQRAALAAWDKAVAALRKLDAIPFDAHMKILERASRDSLMKDDQWILRAREAKLIGLCEPDATGFGE